MARTNGEKRTAPPPRFAPVVIEKWYQLSKGYARKPDDNNGVFTPWEVERPELSLADAGLNGLRTSAGLPTSLAETFCNEENDDGSKKASPSEEIDQGVTGGGEHGMYN